MRSGKFFALSLSAFLLGSEAPSMPSRAAGPRIIFAVWPIEKGKQPEAPILDSIVLLEGSNFKNPMNYLNEEQSRAQASYDAFVKDYLQPGQKYRMLFGGSGRGTITVGEPAGITCESLSATIKAPVPSVNGQRALAASSIEEFGLHPNWRTPATTEQRAEFLKLAADLLAKHGRPNVGPGLIKVDNLRATKLGIKRADALIGSISVKEKSAIHNLFLVAEQQDAQWRVILSTYHVGQDVEDGTDIVVESFVDQLDLDNDGIDEIVTISGYYESLDYTIYKEQNRIWQKVYRGGGGGC